MNALYRDLNKLDKEFETINKARVEQDEWRLNFHLMPPIGWLNDPNGLCELNGEYHIFYQYSPFNAEGGLKFWGHYVSSDMINWMQLPTALYADQTYDCHGVYSGSALIEDGKMYLYYTGNVKHMGKDFDYITNGREHNTVLAISEDGKTFSHKELLMQNRDYGVDMTRHVRDPKVWKEDGNYYMVQGARDVNNKGQIILFASKDKFNWSRINTISVSGKFGYMWECPDLFKLDDQNILLVSPQGIEEEGIKYQNIYQSGYYLVNGDYKTQNYTLSEFEEIDRGFDFYAPQTFLDSKGRRIMIGWMGLPDIQDLYSNPTVEKGWQHALTLPRELKFQNNKLLQIPLEELQTLRKEHKSFLVENELIDKAFSTFELDLQVENLAGDLDIVIKEGAKITYAASEKCLHLSFDKGGYGRVKRSVAVDKIDNIRIFCDTSSLEIFVNGGEEVFTTRFYPDPENQGVRIKGKDLIAQLNLWEMGAMTIEK